MIFFIVMIVALVAVSQVLYSFYIQLYNDGLITDVQTLSLGGATLAAVIGITIFVGVRYILHLKKVSVYLFSGKPLTISGLKTNK